MGEGGRGINKTRKEDRMENGRVGVEKEKIRKEVWDERN
jgi:hypothetical protein